MKIRSGFVSNSSSSSDLLCYDDCSLLKDAKAILQFLKKDMNSEVLLIGKEFGEGRDILWLSQDEKRLILKFPDRWNKNGDKVYGVVFNTNALYSSDEDDLNDPEKFKERYQHVDIVERDYCSTDLLSEFFNFYFLYGSFDDFEDVHERENTPEPVPYSILYRVRVEEELTKESVEKWFDEQPRYPIFFCFKNPVSDYLLTLIQVGDTLPTFSLTNQLILYVHSDDNSAKDFILKNLKKLNSKRKKGDVDIYKGACLVTKDKVHLEGNFFIESFFGAFVFVTPEELEEEL